MSTEKDLSYTHNIHRRLNACGRRDASRGELGEQNAKLSLCVVEGQGPSLRGRYWILDQIDKLDWKSVQMV